MSTSKFKCEALSTEDPRHVLSPRASPAHGIADEKSAMIVAPQEGPCPIGNCLQ